MTFEKILIKTKLNCTLVCLVPTADLFVFPSFICSLIKNNKLNSVIHHTTFFENIYRKFIKTAVKFENNINIKLSVLQKTEWIPKLKLLHNCELEAQ